MDQAQPINIESDQDQPLPNHQINNNPIQIDFINDAFNDQRTIKQTNQISKDLQVKIVKKKKVTKILNNKKNVTKKNGKRTLYLVEWDDGSRSWENWNTLSMVCYSKVADYWFRQRQAKRLQGSWADFLKKYNQQGTQNPGVENQKQKNKVQREYEKVKEGKVEKDKKGQKILEKQGIQRIGSKLSPDKNTKESQQSGFQPIIISFNKPLEPQIVGKAQEPQLIEHQRIQHQMPSEKRLNFSDWINSKREDLYFPTFISKNIMNPELVKSLNSQRNYNIQDQDGTFKQRMPDLNQNKPKCILKVQRIESRWMALVEWQGDFQNSWVCRESIKQKSPKILLEYYENFMENTPKVRHGRGAQVI